ncbi:MAG: MFS transporter [Chloroflexota bacterium]|nr:MAG: MFS transporter [Chloroflexota bacterium]
MASPSVVMGTPLTRFHWKITSLAGVATLLVAVDQGVLSFALAQLVAEWGLQPIHIAVIAITAAVGALCGSIVLGNLADRIGRRSSLRLALFLMALGTVLGAVSWDWISLAAFQLIAGFGIGGVAPVVGAFVSEFAPAKSRGKLVTAVEGFYGVGAIMAALGSLVLLPAFGWRLALVFGGIPWLWVLVQKRVMPESPRYLAARGRLDEARQFLSHIQATYGVNIEGVLGQPSAQNRGLIASLGELWSGPLARRTACTWLLWFVVVYASYGVFVWLPTLLAVSGLEIMRSIQYMLIFTAVQIPSLIAAAVLVDIVGRKYVLVPTLLVGGIAAYLFGGVASPVEILLWGSVLSLAIAVARGVMVSYTAELFPTRVRGTGAGSASAFGRIGSIIVPGAMTLAISSWSVGYGAVFIMFSSMLCVGALGVAILGEETKGRSLEEIGADAL